MAPLVNSALGSDLVPLLRSLSLHEKLAAVALHRLDHRPPATPPQHPLLPPAPRQPPQQQQQQQSSSSPTTAGGSVPHEFPAVLAAYRSTCQMLSLPAADADVLRAALDALAAIGAVSRSAAAAAGRGGGGRRWTGGARGRATAGGPGGSGGEVSLRVSADDMKVAFEDLKLLQPLLLLNSK